MVCFFIRHSHDEFEDNTNFHRHDHPLSEKGKQLAKRTAEKLIRKFGEPDLIIATPMKRGKDTVRAMGKAISSNPRVIFDPNISRYFSSTEQGDPSVYKSTSKENIPIVETWKEFKERVINHIQNLKEMSLLGNDKVVWVITHSLVLKEVAKYFNTEIPRRIKFMYYFYVHSKPHIARGS